MATFVVTGCGRSGTTFTAHVLQRLGVDARHEAFFPYIKRVAPGVYYNRHTKRRHWGRLAWGDWAEIAWQAAPFLGHIDPGLPVLHQLRHPAAFIRSRMAKGITHSDLMDRYTGIRIDGQGARGLQEAPDPIKLRYLAQFWIRWNGLVQARARGPSLCLRIEDLTADTAPPVLAHLGVTATPSQIATAFAQVPGNTNTRTGGPATLDWSHLPKAERDALDSAAAHYGYAL